LDARQQFGRELYLTTARWRGHLDQRLRRLGLTRARWSVLVELSKSGDTLSQRQLASRIGVEAPALVRMLDSLEAGGYVERLPDANDRRTKRLRLTEMAKGITREISVASTEVRQRLLRNVGDKDLDIAMKVLSLINVELDTLE
jgi:MarR family transcriptional regulator for hemolysin